LGHSDTEHMPKDVEGYPYQPVPLLVSALQDTIIVQIACGDAHTVALSREGLLFSWGGGGCGQLGHSETTKMPKDEDGCPYQLTPRVVQHLRPHVVANIACGKAHTIAVSDKGKMFTWGAGACGQLGHPDTSSFPSDEDGYPFQPVPREVEELSEHRIEATACGDVHTLALSAEGLVFSFGGGSYGQLGIKDVGTMPVDADNCPYMPTPQLVAGITDVIRLACGDSHSLTVDIDGALFCWGANSCGQLGILNPDDPRIRKDPDGIPHLPTPAALEALADQKIVDVACGEAHSLAVSAMGNLYSWGACSCGQLGLGGCDGMPVDSDGYPYQPTPTLVTAGFRGKAVLSVACGGVHNLAVTEPDQSLANSLSTLVNESMLADLSFCSSDRKCLYAHSCILSVNAPVLYDFVEAQLRSLPSDGRRGASEELPEIDMPNVRSEVLADFLHYVYTLDVDASVMSLSSFPAIIELYHLCTKFRIGPLLPKCRRIIRQQLGRQSIGLPHFLSGVGGDGTTGLPGPDQDLCSGTSCPSSFSRSEARRRARERKEDEGSPSRGQSKNTARALGLLPGEEEDPPIPGSSASAASSYGGFADGWPIGGAGDGGWGLFFLPGGQALVLDGSAYQEALRRGTLLDLADGGNCGEADSPSLEERMARLLFHEESSDVRLVVRSPSGVDVEQAAHKCILACRSAYFRALLSSDFREKSSSRLTLEDITPEQLVHLLKFMYTDEWMVEDADYALSMLPVADCFSVLDLKQLCERTLICTMCVDNVARIFSLADKYSCARLRGRALIFMTDMHNFHAVMKTEGFADLEKALILDILRSHKITPPPAPLPSEPLPGNSATAAKAGQSKFREHRHARGSAGGGGGAPTARAAQSAAASIGQDPSDGPQASTGGSSGSRGPVEVGQGGGPRALYGQGESRPSASSSRGQFAGSGESVSASAAAIVSSSSSALAAGTGAVAGSILSSIAAAARRGQGPSPPPSTSSTEVSPDVPETGES